MVVGVGDASALSKLTSTGQLVVVDFFATWCRPCMQFKPHFEQLSKDHPSVLFAKVDVDAAKNLAAAHRIEAMPTFILFIGDNEVARIKGADLGQLQRLIAQHKSNARSSATPRLPSSVGDLKKMLVDASIDCSGFVEKKEFIAALTASFSVKELKALLQENNVDFNGFVEKCEYRDAVALLVTESMRRK
jgi:thioredoxin